MVVSSSRRKDVREREREREREKERKKKMKRWSYLKSGNFYALIFYFSIVPK